MTAKQDKVINIIMTIIMTIIMSTFFGAFSLITQGNFTWIGFLYNLIQGFFVGHTIGALIPGMAIGAKVANMFGLNMDSIAGYFVQTGIHAIIFVGLISFFSMFLTMGFTSELFPAYFSSLPLSLLAGYILILVVTKPMINFVQKYV